MFFNNHIFHMINSVVQNGIIRHGVSFLALLICVYEAVNAFNSKKSLSRKKRTELGFLLLLLAFSVVLTMSNDIFLDFIAIALIISVYFTIRHFRNKDKCLIERINHETAHNMAYQRALLRIAESHNGVSLDLDQMVKILKKVKAQQQKSKRKEK